MTDAPPTAIIECFVEEYCARSPCDVGVAERVMLSDALQEFLLDEWWLGGNVGASVARAEFDVLAKELSGQGGPLATVARLSKAYLALAARAIRGDHALEVAREHVMMLSNQLKKGDRAQAKGDQRDQA